jgi:hypothetical protein
MKHKKGRVGLRRALNQQSMATAMLDLHCRQKAPNEKTHKAHIFVVAVPQHEFYKQVIHNFNRIAMNNLCVICGASEDMSDWILYKTTLPI